MEGALYCHKNHLSQLYVSMKVHSQTEKTFLAIVRIEPTVKGFPTDSQSQKGRGTRETF